MNPELIADVLNQVKDLLESSDFTEDLANGVVSNTKTPSVQSDITIKFYKSTSDTVDHVDLSINTQLPRGGYRG